MLIETGTLQEVSTSAVRSPRPITWSTDSDRELAIRAEGRLRKCGYLGLRCIVCEAHEGVVVLRGRVVSYYLKQLAQEVVRRVAGAETIVNRIEVCEQSALRRGGE